MPVIDITTKGRIRLTLNGAELSSHVVETEALEKALAHAMAHGDGTYVLKYPEKHVRVVGTVAPVDGSVDTERPTDVGTLTETGRGATFVSFSWGAASDNVGVTGYQVFDNGVPIATTASTSYTANNLTPSTAHSFQVQAFDAAGNVSLNLSPALNVTTNSNAAPSWNAAQQELTTNVAYSLLLTTICSDADSNPITFSIVSGTLPAGLTFNSVAKTVSGTPTVVGAQAVTFRASDGIATADATITFNVLNADTTAPNTPGQPAAPTVGTNSVVLTWSAVTDQTVANARTSGLAGYRVRRDGALRQDVGNVLTYTDNGVSSSTPYSYTLRAYDAAGNESPDSVARNVTTAAATDIVTGNSVTLTRAGGGFGATGPTYLTFEMFASSIPANPTLGSWRTDFRPAPVYDTTTKFAGAGSVRWNYGTASATYWGGYMHDFAQFYSKIYQSFRFRHDGAIATNSAVCKLVQIHGNNGTGDFAPGWMTGSSAGGWLSKLTLEDVTDNPSFPYTGPAAESLMNAANQWRHIEVVGKQSSAANVADGRATLYYDGTAYRNLTNVVTRKTASRWSETSFLHGGNVNATSNSTQWVDEFYLTAGWARVIARQGSLRVPQRITSWSDTSVTIEFYKSALAAGSCAFDVYSDDDVLIETFTRTIA